MVATQECDLDVCSPSREDAVVELRPVREVSSGTWGIRSRVLRLSPTQAIRAEDPRLMVSPAVLTSLEGAREAPLDPGRVLALKTWLGLRYDRPAVPEEYVALSKAIAEKADELADPIRDRLHDVLMQFEGTGSATRYHFSRFSWMRRTETRPEDGLQKLPKRFRSRWGLPMRSMQRRRRAPLTP